MHLRRTVLIVGITALSVTVGADQPPPPPRAHVMLAPADIKFAAAPRYLPKGAEQAVLAGDMTRPGLFVARIKFPANYRIPPHWHSADEHVTVLSGSVTMGMGKIDDNRDVKTLEAGSHALLPARQPHYLRTSTDAVVQRTVVGPFRTTYVNAADDPSRVK